MRTLSYYLQNPFTAHGISIDELLAFSTDNVQRMISSDPGGLFPERITATSAALSAVGATDSDNRLKLGLRKTHKTLKDAFRTALPGNISKIYVVVTAKYGENGAQLNTCFPEGRKAFGKAADDRIASHLNSLIDGLTSLQPDLGAQVVTDAQGLLTSWQTLYAASEESSSEKSSTEQARRAARAALQLELFKNLLTIALHFPDQPEQLALFMQQSLLEDHPAQEPAPAPEPPTP